MQNCWRVNEYWIVDITVTEFLIQKLSAAFETKSLLELGGDDLNFMNFKIDSFKIRYNSWILGNFKIHKIRILKLWWRRVVWQNFIECRFFLEKKTKLKYR